MVKKLKKVKKGYKRLKKVEIILLQQPFLTFFNSSQPFKLMYMKIISWNVNGIRAVIKKGFLDFLKKEKPDILCLQEIKINDMARAKENFDFANYREFWNSAERPGYSGTVILAREGIEMKELQKFPWDNEGRVQIMDVGKFYLANIYFPNANHELSRLGFKIKFNNKLLKEIKKLENPSTSFGSAQGKSSGQGKPFIICGDYNVAHQEIDLARPKENIGNAGFTDEERAWMTKFLKAGFVDTFRHFYPGKVEYSWWSYRMRAREKNIGWRIDYFCVSKKLINKTKKAFIMNNIHGSDHCPVGIEIIN